MQAILEGHGSFDNDNYASLSYITSDDARNCFLHFVRLLTGFWIALVTSRVTGVSVDSYISSEKPIAKANLLANIGSHGSKAPGALPGIVVASPSTVNPNYYYFWLRDGSLTFKYIVDEFVSGRDSSLHSLVDDFVGANSVIQGVDTPSGTAASGNNLGEPKYYVNETEFTDPWGRPQRDGPALRITVLSTYAKWLMAQGKKSQVTTSPMWSIIEKDATYVMNTWNRSTFDLWEEIESSSFFTTAVQHRALREAVLLGKAIGKTSDVAAWSTQADNIFCFQQSYWNPSAGYMTANTGGGRSGIDANTVLTSIHTFDPNAGCDAATFQPCSDEALSNLLVYVDSFRKVFSIDTAASENSAVATGRYMEDIYMGGNPWYLTTFAVAEQLYLALNTWRTQGFLEITPTSLPFFKLFSTSAKVGTFTRSSSTYFILTFGIKNYADGFVAINAKYTPANGSLSEQFSKTDGTPLSAADLTWSYASALTAFNARAGVLPGSWGANGLQVPNVCHNNPGPTVQTTFTVFVNDTTGSNIILAGNVDVLGDWNPANAVPLKQLNTTFWSAAVTLPAGSGIEYKYIKKAISDGSLNWESDPNDSTTTPNGGEFVINDVWHGT